MCFQRGIQRFFGGRVVYEFNTDEQAAAANVADKGGVVQGAVQFGAQLLAARHDVFQQMIRLDDMLPGKRRGTGRGVAHIGVAVLKEAAAQSEKRRVGEEGVSTCSVRGGEYHYKQNITETNGS